MSATTSDQQRFDREVAVKGKLFLQVLAGLAIFAALVMSIIALSGPGPRETVIVRSGSGTPTSAAGGGGQAPAAAAPSQTAAATPAPSSLYLKVIPEGKRGPEGKLHDAFTITEFHVTVGKPLQLTIDNTDTVPHSITAPEAGVNIIVEPGTHTYTLLVDKPGRFEWHCIFPCDPWSMEHVGYMRGFITATTA